MQGPRYQKDDVIDHVTVCNEIQERRKGLNGMIPQMLKFDDELLTKLIVDRWHGEGAGFVGQECSIVGALQVKLQICW